MDGLIQGRARTVRWVPTRERLRSGRLRRGTHRMTSWISPPTRMDAAQLTEEGYYSIFGKAGEMLASDAIMASNTSSIPITRMANYAPDPARFIGLHFFNPVPVMGLIEVIPGLATNKDVTDPRKIEMLVSAGEAELRELAHPDPYTRARPAVGPLGHPETWDKGIDDLEKRCKEAYAQGARFAKWRNVLQIDPAQGLPSEEEGGAFVQTGELS